MADASKRSQPRKLHKPYAKWNRQIEDVRTILQAVQQQDLSGCRSTMASGCLSYVISTLSNVESFYSLFHGGKEYVLQYDLMRAHSLASLAERLLGSSDGFIGIRPVLSSEDEAAVYRLCGLCIGICAQILKWLPKEAAETRRIEKAHARAAARTSQSAAAGTSSGPVPAQQQTRQDHPWPSLDGSAVALALDPRASDRSAP